MEEFATPQIIIKALKGSSDPLNKGGPSKIEVAKYAWDSTSIRFPNKDEVLAEWIFTSFVKEKGNISPSSVLLSEAYWSLLNSILYSSLEASRSNRVWLPPLLTRYSISPMIVSFLNAMKNSKAESFQPLLQHFAQCMYIIWPIVTTRQNLDSLSECFNAVLSYSSTFLESRELKLDRFSLLVVRSFRQSFGNSSAKKKAFTTFIQNNFSNWVNIIASEATLGSNDEKLLQSELQQIGIDILFSVDILKSSQDPLETVLSQEKFSPPKTPHAHLKVISFLYKAYVEEIRKHSSTVFGSGSSQSQDQTNQNKYRDAGIKAFSTCYRVLREFEDNEHKWSSILEILEILEAAHLVGNNVSDKNDVFSEVLSSALSQLKGNDKGVQELALKILCVLSRIDFDLLNPRLSDILSNLLTLNPMVYPSCNHLLHEILEFNIRARSLPAYISYLINCFSDFSSTMRSSNKYADIKFTIQDCLSGSLLGFSHIESLSQAIRNFLTPGQTPEVAQDIIAAFKTYKDSIFGNEDAMDLDETIPSNTDAKKSHRRQSRGNVPSPTKEDYAALSYALVSRFVAIVLPSLPYSSLSEASRESALSSISGLSSDLENVLDKVFSSDSTSSTWAMQCISTASLRIRHAFYQNPYLNLLEVSVPKEVYDKISNLIRSTQTIPELIVEIFRSFFDAETQITDEQYCEVVLGHLMTYITTNLGIKGTANEIPSLKFSWDGLSSSLNSLGSDGHSRAALAVWYLTLDKWLPMIEECTSQQQLQHIAALCLIQGSNDDVDFQKGITFPWIVERAMQSALFWELPRLRDALVHEIDSSFPKPDVKEYASYPEQSLSGPSSKGKKTKASWDLQKLLYAQSTFLTLLRGPKEYLSRASRMATAQRALVTDFESSLCASDAKANISLNICRRTQALARAWLVANAEYVSLWDVMTEPDKYIGSLLQSSDSEKDVDELHSRVTTELLISAFRQVIRLSIHGEIGQFSKICHLLQEAANDGKEMHLLTFVELLLTECTNPSKLPASVLATIKELSAFLRAHYLPLMEQLASDMNRSAWESENIVRSWRIYIALRHWLGCEGNEKLYGVKILQGPILSKGSSENQKSLAMQVFHLLLEELHSTKERMMHLSVICASYVLLERIQLSEQTVCDPLLIGAMKDITVTEYSHVLSFIREALEKSTLEKHILVHLSRVLLEVAPEGAMRIIQEHSEESLQIFLGDEVYIYGNVSLSTEVLAFVETIVITRPAFLRLTVLGPIWVLLSNFLTGRASGTPESHPSILRSICSIIGSIIRLRRDLVTSTLSHLVIILRLALHTVCAPRPQLGTRQLALVTDTQPWWISSTSPLGISEAKNVARLLTALQAKTTPRTFVEKTKTKERTAESLLAPFSKHAASVISAYLGDLADPLLSIPTNVREALAPGLYALCESMGELGRNALMAWTSDPSGKAALKSLWHDYEKQRYVGKG